MVRSSMSICHGWVFEGLVLGKVENLLLGSRWAHPTSSLLDLGAKTVLQRWKVCWAAALIQPEQSAPVLDNKTSPSYCCFLGLICIITSLDLAHLTPLRVMDDPNASEWKIAQPHSSLPKVGPPSTPPFPACHSSIATSSNDLYGMCSQLRQPRSRTHRSLTASPS